MGIYIDIVPMDGYPDSNTLKHISNVRIIRNLMVRRFRIKNCIRDKFDYMSFTKEKVKFKLFKDLIYSFIDYVTLPFGYNFWWVEVDTPDELGYVWYHKKHNSWDFSDEFVIIVTLDKLFSHG